MDADEFEWKDSYVDIKLTEARIIAILDNGGTIIEDKLPLMISEGRAEASTYISKTDGFEYSLDYMCQFGVDGGPDFESSSWAAARIVIHGTHESGIKLEIIGSGFMGYNDRGSPEGNFEEPPEMRVLIGKSPADKLKEEAKQTRRRIDRSRSPEGKTKH